jgi:hypothetical protein
VPLTSHSGGLPTKDSFVDFQSVNPFALSNPATHETLLALGLCFFFARVIWLFTPAIINIKNAEAIAFSFFVSAFL